MPIRLPRYRRSRPQGRGKDDPDPDRKPTKQEMRAGGMVAAAVLVFLGLFTLVLVLMS